MTAEPAPIATKVNVAGRGFAAFHVHRRMTIVAKGFHVKRFRAIHGHEPTITSACPQKNSVSQMRSAGA